METPHPQAGSPAANPAETYEQYFVPAMFRPWALKLLLHAQPQPGQRLLDIACGTGIVAREAAARVGPAGQVVALDLNPAMLAVGRAQPAPRGADIQWHDGNAQALPLPDAAFDTALCQHGLPFFPDAAAALGEMHRVLVPGGRAVVMVLQSLGQHPVFEALFQSVARHLALPISAVATPFALSDAPALQALFEAAGFTPVSITTETIEARFAEPQRFVPMAVASSAAAVPAFAQLAEPARAALLSAIAADVEPALQPYRQTGAITFAMHAHVVVATK